MTNLTEQDLPDKFVKIVENSHKIVFFGGAGVSTESGIPDFRSTDGLYNTKYDYPPETILSDEFFYAHTEEFYRFTATKCCICRQNPTLRILRWLGWRRLASCRLLSRKTSTVCTRRQVVNACTICTGRCIAIIA